MVNNCILRNIGNAFGFSLLNRKISSLIILLIIIPASSGFAVDQKTYDENLLISSFFRNLYDFSFNAADSLIVLMEGSNLDQVTFSNIKADLAWWKLLSGDKIETNLKICNENLEESIRTNLGNNYTDITSLFNIIFSYSLKARLENYRGNTLKAFVNFYKSAAYIEKCIDTDVPDEKLYLVLGLYYYFIDYIENRYFILNALFFSYPKGDKNKGLIYLETCSLSDNDMIRTEANYFLMKIYADTEKEYPKALLYAQILIRQHPNNLVYCMEQFKLLLKMKKTEEARAFQKELIKGIQMAKNINYVQKNHFLSQITALTKNPVENNN